MRFIFFLLTLLSLYSAKAACRDTTATNPALRMQVNTVAVGVDAMTNYYRPFGKHTKFWFNTAIIGFGIIAGIADGQREVIQHNKWAYRYRHPNANEYWWNPDSTWKRADGRGNNTLSGSFFAFTKDKYHTNGMIRTSMLSMQYALGATILVNDAIAAVQQGRPVKLLKHLLWSIFKINAPYMLAKYFTHRYYDVF